MITIRKSNERGFFNHGWLKSYHSFSFANYYDPKHIHFGNLRVINEDFIAPKMGFGKHPHNNMEIITYVISGELSHKDSMGNSSKILPGEVQIMSAGTGVFHSEFCESETLETHLLQIWILPKEKEITPRYGQKSFTDSFAEKDFVLVVSGSGRDGSIQINQDAEIYVGKFSENKNFEFTVKKDRKIWIQMVDGKISLNGKILNKGDAAAIEKEEILNLKIEEKSEFLLFDL
ncbi:MAG: pirin family protein [Pelagibacterales bacterium]|nr:pirin family protein [Pelagibacterales bacterium]